jgi:hypothetical protein
MSVKKLKVHSYTEMEETAYYNMEFIQSAKIYSTGLDWGESGWQL